MSFDAEPQQDEIIDLIEEAKQRAAEGRYTPISDWTKGGSDAVMIKRLVTVVDSLSSIAGNLAIQCGQLRLDVAELREQLSLPGK